MGFLKIKKTKKYTKTCKKLNFRNQKVIKGDLRQKKTEIRL
jgi:hypothetical protein